MTDETIRISKGGEFGESISSFGIHISCEKAVLDGHEIVDDTAPSAGSDGSAITDGKK